MPNDKKMTVCLVDDEQIIVKMYQAKFELEGFTVIIAANGNQALELIQQKLPDIILLDIVMPGISGLQVLKRLKTSEKTKKIPIILLTNIDSPEDRRRGCELGALYYLLKSEYLPGDVVKLVKEILAVAGQVNKK